MTYLCPQSACVGEVKVVLLCVRFNLGFAYDIDQRIIK